MRNRRAVGLAIAAALAAMAIMAFAVASASATTVTPANKVITATLKPETRANIYLWNGYLTTFLSCANSEAKFTTPKEGKASGWANTNEPNTHATKKVGGGEFSETLSVGQGSVSARVFAVSFTECTYRVSEKAGALGISIFSVTMGVPQASKWTIAADRVAAGVKPQVALAMPDRGIEYTAFGCETRFGSDPAGLGGGAVVMGDYDNSKRLLRLDGQLNFRTFNAGEKEPTGSCKEFQDTALAGPAQFEAEYNLNEVFNIE